MKTRLIEKFLLGAALGFSFVAASISSLIKSPIKTDAGVVSSASGQSAPDIGTYLTAGKLVYINIANSGDDWNNKKYAFRFVDDSGTTTNSAFSSFAVHANDGTSFYCAAVPADEAHPTAKWASISVVCYATTATSPSGDYDTTTTIAGGSKTLAYITPQTTGNNEFHLTAGSVASGTNVAKVITSGFIFRTWASLNEGFDLCSVWSQNFVDETDVSCALLGQSGFATSLNYYWNNNATSYSSLTTGAKSVFTGTTSAADKYTNINAALARYKRLYYLYHNKSGYTINNFASLTGLTSLNGANEAVPLVENSEGEAALIISGTIALLSAGAFVLLKKKRKVA
jgi:LPXTG-motif cell wall-anchored protein